MSPALYFAIPGDLESLTGGYAYDRRLIAELRALGWEVTVVPLASGFPYPDAAALQAADAALNAIPDEALVLVDGLALGAMDTVATQHSKRLRLVALCHHPLALESGLNENTRTHFLQSEATALSASRAIVVTSPASRALLTHLFGIPATRITVAVPGTDPAPFAACEGQPPVLLCVATLTRRKGHDLLIDALAMLSHLEWQARFVGGDDFDPGWAQTLREKIQGAGLQQRIVLTGSRKDLRAEYQGADIFVLPTRFEGYGMVFTEALSYGLPIVASQIEPVTEIVPPEAGLLVPAENSAALASALERMLMDTTLRATLTQGARESAENLPRWPDTATAVARLLQEIVR
ncbi:MAG: glycosyltransferase family 4 protein [Pseudomonadales bacterium]|nr:glycosyltransferase family 4 protein [Pseudomonadales bacterium]